MRPLWYNKALLEEAGAKVPTTWDELLTAGQALKKIGVSGFATGAGAGNNLGAHTMVAMMINNGGGLFNADGKPDCVTDANIQAMEFVRELSNEGIIDKGAVSYTSDNLIAQWNGKKAAMGINTPGLADQTPRRCRRPGRRGPARLPERHHGRAVLREQPDDVHQHPLAGGVGGVPDLLPGPAPHLLGDPGGPGGAGAEVDRDRRLLHQEHQPGRDRGEVDPRLQDLRRHRRRSRSPRSPRSTAARHCRSSPR